MTVYSGFATRRQEERYDDLICKTIQILSQIVITYVESNKIQPFQMQFHKIFQAVSKLDAMKHCDPKISTVLIPIAQHFGVLPSDEASDMGSDLAQSHAKTTKQRPVTGSFARETRRSIQMERNTINIVPAKKSNFLLDHKKTQSSLQNNRYGRGEKGRKEIRSFSYSSKPSKMKEIGDKLELYHIESSTMEELMEKNRLVERKMSMFRKKKYVNQSKIPARIQELDEEDQISFV